MRSMREYSMGDLNIFHNRSMIKQVHSFDDTEPRRQIVFVAVEKAEYETIDITILRRGVIGVSKIGYVLNAG